MTAKESATTQRILKYLRDRGAFAEKIGAGQRKGMPDILACYRGIFIGLETKRGLNEKPSPAQEQVLKEIGEAGGVSGTYRKVEEVKKVLDWLDGIAKIYDDSPTFLANPCNIIYPA